MNVYIGPYRRWIGPYQLADLLRYIGFSEDRCFEIGEKLSKTWLNDFCQWFDSKKKRKIKVRIDRYDSWNVDSTLAIILVPLLKQLKVNQHGAPFTDDADVPEELRSDKAKPKENEWDTDDLFFKRWTWILDEIIWTFEQLHPEADWESQYFTHPPELENRSLEDEIRLVKVDHAGYNAHSTRIDNGLRLFGKYYRGLWD